MASSLQQYALASQLRKVLGLSNIDFGTYNYKVTKPIAKVVDVIKEFMHSISLRVMRYEHKGDVEDRVILFTLEVQGDFTNLSKPQRRYLREISGSDLIGNNFKMLIGSQHGGFESLICAAEIIRAATTNGIAIKRHVLATNRSIQILKDQIFTGTPAALAQWTYDEVFYLLRELGISSRYLDNLMEYEDDVVSFQLDSIGSDVLDVQIRGVIDLVTKVHLSIVDGVVKDIVCKDNYAMEERRKLYTWLYCRSCNLNAVYQQALLDCKERLENTEEKKQEKLDQLIKEISAASSRTVAYPGLKDRTLAELDVLIKDYVQLRDL